MTTSQGPAISALVRAIFIEANQQIDSDLRQVAEVTPQQAIVLQMIAAHPGLIQKDIVDVMHRRAATVSAFLKKLETAGLITRQIPADNSRNKQLFLTQQGEQVVSDFQSVRNTVEEKLAKNLSAAQQKMVITLLESAQRGLQEK